MRKAMSISIEGDQLLERLKEKFQLETKEKVLEKSIKIAAIIANQIDDDGYFTLHRKDGQKIKINVIK